MSNDIFDTLKLTTNSQQPEFADLDALFSQTRAHEPRFVDDNFTKVTVNRLPAKPKRNQPRSTLFDFVGLLLGVVAAYWFFDLGQFTQSALSFVPESLSLTVANVVTVVFLGSGLSWLGWWTAEKAIN